MLHNLTLEKLLVSKTFIIARKLAHNHLEFDEFLITCVYSVEAQVKVHLQEIYLDNQFISKC